MMAKMSDVNLVLDADVAKEMEQVCEELGLSMQEAFTVFAKKVIHEQGIPFPISL